MAAQTFLLLHGNPERESCWDSLRRELPVGLATVAGTLPGFSGVPVPRLDCTLTALAQAAYSWLPASPATSDLVIVGHSHGGAVALEFARLWPQRVRALVLIASIGATPHLSYRLLRCPLFDLPLWSAARICGIRAVRRMTKTIYRWSARSAFHPAPVPEAWLDAEIDAGLADGFPLLSMGRVVRDNPCAQVRKMVAAIDAPVLLLHGEDDRLVPIAIGRELARLLPNCTYEPIANAGHMLPNTHGHEMAARIQSWLTTLPPPASSQPAQHID